MLNQSLLMQQCFTKNDVAVMFTQVHLLLQQKKVRIYQYDNYNYAIDTN
jgi:hypothetical protein